MSLITVGTSFSCTLISDLSVVSGTGVNDL